MSESRSASLPERARFAAARLSGAAAVRASAWSGRGRGTVLRGAIGLRVYPGLLEHLASGTTVVMVTGTNGKTTSTNMTAAAVGATGARVACNSSGANMAEGIASALLAQPKADASVLEVDEVYLGRIGRQMTPSVVTLLNLSREFTRGVSLGRTIEVWRAFFADVTWPMTVVANADDPLVVWSLTNASAHITTVWVAGGNSWYRDAEVCPRCGGAMQFSTGSWHCSTGDFTRPNATFSLDGVDVVGPTGRERLPLAGPGEWRKSNALFAIATACQTGVPLGAAVQSAGAVDDVDGRYGEIVRGDHRVRLFMVKNPASWAEALTLADEDAHLVLTIDQFGIKDTTPLWDVDIERFGLKSVTVSGHRYADIAARLEVAHVAFDVVEDVLAAIDAAPSGAVNIIANYSAFTALVKRLRP